MARDGQHTYLAGYAPSTLAESSAGQVPFQAFGTGYDVVRFFSDSMEIQEEPGVYFRLRPVISVYHSTDYHKTISLFSILWILEESQWLGDRDVILLRVTTSCCLSCDDPSRRLLRAMSIRYLLCLIILRELQVLP